MAIWVTNRGETKWGKRNGERNKLLTSGGYLSNQRQT